MLMGHTDGLSELRSSRDHLSADPGSELDDDDTVYSSEQILYTASFEELARSSIKYDTVIWLSISLLLVLAWGVGIIMLLYLPFKRYILRKDISSRRLYVTPSEIVYKVQNYSFSFHLLSVRKRNQFGIEVIFFLSSLRFQGLHSYPSVEPRQLRSMYPYPW